MKMFLLLHTLFFFFSASGVLSKYASEEEFLSLPFILFVGASVGILFFYSIFWQVVLQKTSLVMAYSNRGIVVIWGIMWGVVLFNEIINIATVVATVLIIAGIAIASSGDKKEEVIEAT